jgi:hypothetical protein
MPYCNQGAKGIAKSAKSTYRPSALFCSLHNWVVIHEVR